MIDNVVNFESYKNNVVQQERNKLCNDQVKDLKNILQEKYKVTLKNEDQLYSLIYKMADSNVFTEKVIDNHMLFISLVFKNFTIWQKIKLFLGIND